MKSSFLMQTRCHDVGRNSDQSRTCGISSGEPSGDSIRPTQSSLTNSMCSTSRRWSEIKMHRTFNSIRLQNYHTVRHQFCFLYSTWQLVVRLTAGKEITTFLHNLKMPSCPSTTVPPSDHGFSKENCYKLLQENTECPSMPFRVSLLAPH